MNFLEFMTKLADIATDIVNTNVNPKDIKVCIYNDLGECVGNISDISLNIDIKEEDIPYDVHGLEIINEHDNVLIIQGD